MTVNAGGLALLGDFNGSGSFTDADFAGHTFTATVNYGDGTIKPLALNGATFTLVAPVRDYSQGIHDYSHGH